MRDRYFIDFNKWAVLVNDEQTRSFLALEVMGAGLSEVYHMLHQGLNLMTLK